MSQRVVLQPGYILHLKPFRDTSALVELITPEFGRMGLVARGIRSPASKLRSVVQPFSPLLVSWSGRGELPNLIGAESQGKPLFLQADALACGLYMNELLMRLTHRDEAQIELFSVYDESLRQLGELRSSVTASLQLQQTLRQFEIKLLQSLGYGLLLAEEAGKGERIRSERTYDYQLEIGPVAFADPHQEVFGFKVSGKTLLALANNSMLESTTDRAIYKEAKHLLRFVLDRYLGDKPLLSRQLLRRKSTTPEICN